MIGYQKDRKPEMKQNMRGGSGSVSLAPLFEAKIPHMRLLSVITMEPGSSIGAHEHEQEAEVFYCLEGEATVLDGGQEVVLQVGDAHLCSDGEVHALMNKGSVTMRVLAVIPTLAV